MQKLWFSILVAIAIFLFFSSAFSQVKHYSNRFIGSGLETIHHFDKLHHLRTGLFSFSSTSYDRHGRNFDGCCDTYLYKEGDEYVIADVTGPGIIQRIWTTNYMPYDTVNRIRIYFDGEKVPRLDESIADFFGGELAHLPYPICAYPEKTSGGFYCYVSFPFEKSVKITMTRDDYYQVNYLRINPWVEVKSWQKKTDYSSEIELWNSSGKDPKNLDYSYLEFSKHIPAYSKTELAYIDNGRSTIGQFFLKVPSIIFQPRISDSGLSFGYQSRFDIKINPNHNKVKLVRRLDYGVADQKAKVFVDGKLAREWFTPGSNLQDRWLDSEFFIPETLSNGKSKLHIIVEFVSSERDWNEFRYWIYSDNIISDSLDIGNPVSEKEHNYEVEFLIWEGTRDYQYPSADSASIDIIDSVFLQVYWDDLTEPSINAPLAMAFGGGMSNPVKFQSMPAGVSESNEFYLYFPMPYSENARVVLDNRSSYNLNNVNLKIGIYNDTVPMKKLGYFHIHYNESIPTLPLVDHLLFQAEGTGHFVGVSLEGRDSWGGYLEGDERFYTEGSRTPFYSGTGTEDYFNCGFHYKYGNLIAPIHGYTIEIGETRAQYRWHITDPIPFYSQARFGFEHGMENYQTPDYYSTAFYYLNYSPTAIPTDQFHTADSNSANKHNYKCTGDCETKDLISNFGFELIHDIIQKSGVYHQSVSEFIMKIEPENSGVLLMRVFDYSNLNQQADVYLDGSFAGKWLNAGSNTFSMFKEDVFILSPEFTFGKENINIRIDARRSPSLWSEFSYKTFSLFDSDTATIDTTNDTTSVILDRSYPSIKSGVFPNPAINEFKFWFCLENDLEAEISLYDIEGNKLLSIANKLYLKGNNIISIDTNRFSSGTYLIVLQKNAFVVFSEKIVIK